MVPPVGTILTSSQLDAIFPQEEGVKVGEILTQEQLDEMFPEEGEEGEGLLGKLEKGLSFQRKKVQQGFLGVPEGTTLGTEIRKDIKSGKLRMPIGPFMGAGPENPRFAAATAALVGTGADVLTDPLTYEFGAGVFTKIGKVIPGVARLLSAALSGTMGVGAAETAKEIKKEGDKNGYDSPGVIEKAIDFMTLAVGTVGTGLHAAVGGGPKAGITPPPKGALSPEALIEVGQLGEPRAAVIEAIQKGSKKARREAAETYAKREQPLPPEPLDTPGAGRELTITPEEKAAALKEAMGKWYGSREAEGPIPPPPVRGGPSLTPQAPGPIPGSQGRLVLEDLPPGTTSVMEEVLATAPKGGQGNIGEMFGRAQEKVGKKGAERSIRAIEGLGKEPTGLTPPPPEVGMPTPKVEMLKPGPETSQALEVARTRATNIMREAFNRIKVRAAKLLDEPEIAQLELVGETRDSAYYTGKRVLMAGGKRTDQIHLNPSFFASSRNTPAEFANFMVDALTHEPAHARGVHHFPSPKGKPGELVWPTEGASNIEIGKGKIAEVPTELAERRPGGSKIRGGISHEESRFVVGEDILKHDPEIQAVVAKARKALEDPEIFAGLRGEKVPPGKPIAKEMGGGLGAVKGIPEALHKLLTGEQAQKFAKSPIANLSTESRALKSSFDISYLGRQGIIQSIRHPVMAKDNLLLSLKSFASKGEYDKAVAALKRDPITRRAEQAGVDMPVVKGLKEEPYESSRLAELVPGIAGSNRSYDIFLSKSRRDVYGINDARLTQWAKHQPIIDALVKRYPAIFGREGPLHAWKLSPSNMKEVQGALANWINITTGRGGLGRFEDAAGVLNKFMWSARFVASRIALLNPATYVKLAKTNPRLLQIAMEDLAAYAAFTGMLQYLAVSSGMARVEDDPRSSDYMKTIIKGTRTRVNGWGGLLPYIVASAKIYTQKSKRGPYVTELNPPAMQNFLFKLAWSKLSPVPSAAVAGLTGATYEGEKLTWGRAAKDLTLPMNPTNIYELNWDDPLQATLLSILSTIGWDVQTYKPRYGPAPR